MVGGGLVVCCVMLLLVGCSGTGKLSSDPAMNTFLEEVRSVVEGHDWPGVLEVVDRENYETQVRGMGIGEPQYVAELLGLHMVDNSIRRGERVEWSDLERIDDVMFDRMRSTGDWWEVEGSVRLDDGTRLHLNLMVMQDREGRYWLTGGVG